MHVALCDMAPVTPLPQGSSEWVTIGVSFAVLAAVTLAALLVKKAIDKKKDK